MRKLLILLVLLSGCSKPSDFCMFNECNKLSQIIEQTKAVEWKIMYHNTTFDDIIDMEFDLMNNNIIFISRSKYVFITFNNIKHDVSDICKCANLEGVAKYASKRVINLLHERRLKYKAEEFKGFIKKVW